MLSQHPDVLTRLREEIIAKVGVSGRPNHDDLRGMKYLRAFINGVLLAIVSKVSADLEQWYQRSYDYIHPCTFLFSQWNN
jgi:hypothetical protein